MEALNILDTSYSGEFSSFMLTPAVIDMDTVRKSAIGVITGIKKAMSIQTIDVLNIFQARQATPVSQGSININRVLLQPQDYMVYLELNPRDIENQWEAVNLQESLIDEPLPSTVESYMIYQLLKRVGEFNEYSTWRAREEFNPANGGVTPASKNQAPGDSVYQYFNGLIHKLLNDSTTLAISTTTITDSNILSVLQTVYETIPYTLINRIEDIKFCMNYDTHRYYNVALTNLTYKDTFNTDATKQQYKGYDILPLAGMPDNTIIAALAINTEEAAFWLGINSDKDSTQIKYDKVTSASELYYVKMLFKADVNYSWAYQTVLATNILA